MAFDLITIGDISIDQFTKIDDANVLCDINHRNCQICLNYGDKIHVDSFDATIGGNSANVGIACVKLGLSASVYTEVGDDANANVCIDTLKSAGVDVTYCFKNPNSPTNVHAIIVYQGERTILSYHEPRNYKLPKWDVPKMIYYTSLGRGFEKFQQDLVGYINKNPSIMAVFNPGTFQMEKGIDSLRNILEVIDVLLVNKQEAEELTNSETDRLEFLELHKKLQNLGPKLTVITNNEEGSTAYDGKDYITLGILDGVEVVDKTGAGDAYSGGFLSALHHGKNLEEAMKWGSINAAGVITKPGPTVGLYTKKEIEAILSNNPDFV